MYFFAAGLMLVSPRLFAGSWEISASIDIGTEYDSNPELRKHDEKGAWFGSVIPRYSLVWLDQRETVQLDLAAHLERTTRGHVTVRNDPAATLSWQHLNPMSAFSLSGTYEEAATRVVELEESGLRALDGTRSTSSLAADWTQQLSERLKFDAEVSHRLIKYDRGHLQDYSEQKGSFALIRQIDPRVSASLRASATNYEPRQDGFSAQSYAGLAAVSYRFSERLDFSLEGGASFVEGESNHTGWQGST